MNIFESSELVGARVRAASGATPDELLGEVNSLKRLGLNAEVSLAAPCSDVTHRALAKLGARVRVESLDSWVVQAVSDREIFVVGPTLSAAATWRRLAVARGWALNASSEVQESIERHELVEYFA